MTDEPELSPTEREVRRLLADARHDEPMPEDVAARLDRVLAGLSQEPARLAPVTQLAARRRRAAKLLLAAACVVAVGVGIGQVVDIDGSGSADQAGASQESSTEGDGAPTDQVAPEAGEPYAASEPGAAQEHRRHRVVSLSASALFEAVDSLQEEYFLQDGAAAHDGHLTRSRATSVSCAAPSWGRGTFVPVRYDGVPGVLVFRRAVGDTQVADLYLCGSTEPERSITLPAP